MVDADTSLDPAIPRARAADYLRSAWPWVLLVIGVVVVATVLRFWELGKQGLWLDELFSANAVGYGPMTAIRITAQDTNPPLYYVLQSLLVPWLGRSEWAMRVLPAAVGALATAVMYAAARRLFDRMTGAWAAALFAVSAVAIEYAQEARMYSLLLLFAALTLWVFALLVEKPTVLRAALLGVVLAGLAYTHVYGYMAAPMLLVPVVILPSLRSRVGRLMLVTYAVAVLIFLPWLLVLPGQIMAVRSQVASGGWWMQPPTDIGSGLASDLAAFSPGSGALSAAIFFALMMAGLAVRPAAISETVEPKSAAGVVPESELLWVLVTLALGPMLLGLVISTYVTPIATVRNALVCLPAAYLLAVRGGLKLWQPLGFIALASLLLFAALQFPAYYTTFTKGSWRQATVVVTAEPKTGVLTQDWEDVFRLSIYAKLLERSGSLHAIWVKSLDATPTPTGHSADDDVSVSVPEFMGRWDAVYVVSQRLESSLAKYMDRQAGWRLIKTDDLGGPVLRLYTRIPAATP